MSTKSERREELYNTASYFWDEKGNIERAANCPEIFREFPELAEAWAVYLIGKRLVNAALRDIEESL